MRCKNCQTKFLIESDFCYNCGAKVIRSRLTIKNLFEYFSETFLNYDNKFLQTIFCLFKNPENVIVSYVNGVRKKYVNPISFFAISLTISGLYLFIIQRYFPDAMDFSQLYTDENTQKISSTISQNVLDYHSLFYFALIPVMALISWIVFFNKKFNFTEHVVIYLYTMSLGSMVTSIVSLIILFIKPDVFFIVSISSNILLVLYHCYLLKKVFELSMLQIALKTILFSIIFFFLYFAFSILMVLAIIVFTDMSIQDLAPTKR
ncbi:MAG: DUF3667 domain-containing protein [Flavobacteriaceae bacterium]